MNDTCDFGVKKTRLTGRIQSSMSGESEVLEDKVEGKLGVTP